MLDFSGGGREARQNYICKEDFYQDKRTNPPRRSVHRFLPEAEQVRDDPNLMRIMADVSPFQTKNILKEEYHQRWEYHCKHYSHDYNFAPSNTFGSSNIEMAIGSNTYGSPIIFGK